jgi:spore maturation protein CgeB
MFRVIAGARIALNRHIDVAEDYANNMRLYEATGVGSLLLTDVKQNLGELFEVGQEVVAYRDEDELVEAVEHYLAHEDERDALAAAGQRRTLADHTYAVRMRELADIVDAYLH